jgi:MOSC domain-containing protein YiiM
LHTDLNSCAKKPTTSPRQVHIIDSSLFTHLATPSSKHPAFALSPGSLGENITTEGIDLISLSEGTRLHFGDHEGHAIVKVMGLRNPKKRLDEWPEGLLDRCKLKDKKGKTIGRTVGVMGVVEQEGYVSQGYVVYVEKPKHFKALENV